MAVKETERPRTRPKIWARREIPERDLAPLGRREGSVEGKGDRRGVVGEEEAWPLRTPLIWADEVEDTSWVVEGAQGGWR